MSNLDDFDRSVSAFLADGPTRAPEAPLVAVLAHARTTPRRADPLRRFRADVMAPRAVPFGRRPALLLALLALAVAAIGAAVIGGRPSEPAVVIPDSSPTASPVPTIGPSTVPSTIPTGPPVFSRLVPMLVSAGPELAVEVSDATGDLVQAVSLQPGDGTSVAPTDVQIVADPTSSSALVVTWQGQPCETGGSVHVDEDAKVIEIGRQRCVGDALPLDRVLQLTFRSAVSEGEWSGTFVDAPAPSLSPGESPPVAMAPLGPPAVPPLHVVLDDGVGGPTSIDVVDEAGLVARAEAGPQDGGNGSDSIAVTNDSPTTLRVTWPGRPCDTVHRLTINPELTTLTIDAPSCRGDSIGVDRTLLLTFRQQVDAATLKTAIVYGRGGVDLPTWTVTAPDSAGGRYDLVLVDSGYQVNTLEGFFDPGTDTAAAATTGASLTPTNEFTYRLVWAAPDCATSPTLTIDPAGRSWRLIDDPCVAKSTVVRMIDVAVRAPYPSDALPRVEVGTG